MPTFVQLFMQHDRPRTCGECNMCVPRPAEDIPPGSKFTYYCLLRDKELTGRGVKAEDKQFKFRCRPNWYRANFWKHNGALPIAFDKMLHYNIDPSKLPL